MIHDIQRLMDAYHAWLKDKTDLRQVDDWIEITTPYLDRHNDCLQIYAKRATGVMFSPTMATRSTILRPAVASCRVRSGRNCSN